MALFAGNTGCRDPEICSLKWDWEVSVPQLETSVFIIPGTLVNNGDERLVVLNRIAKSVVEARRWISLTHVFTCRGKPITRMMTSGWKRARMRIELPQARGPWLEAHLRAPAAHCRGELRRRRAGTLGCAARAVCGGCNGNRLRHRHAAAQLPWASVG
jgi:integrase